MPIEDRPRCQSERAGWIAQQKPEAEIDALFDKGEAFLEDGAFLEDSQLPDEFFMGDANVLSWVVC